MIRHAPLLCAVLATLAALVVAPASRADVARTLYVARTPISFADVNPCNGDLVFLDGTMAEVLNEVVDANGSTHATYNMRLLDFGGRDANGDELRLVGGAHAIVYVADPQSVQSFWQNQTVVGPGPANNWEIDVLFRAVVNDQGDLVVSVDEVTTSCQ